MAETPYNHYALYEPDASPDLTATGEYNRAIMGIDSDMHAEETERAYADKQLSDRITTLGNQEVADVRDLNAKILAEEMNRVSADSSLATDIDNEKKARTNYDALIEREYKAADAKLTADLAAETAERKTDTQAAREERTRIEREYKAADAKMDERITTLNNQEIADIRDVNAKLAQEVTDRKAADTALDNKITGGLNNVTNGLTTVGNAISKVEADYKAADVALGKRIDNAEGEISANSADLTGIKSLTYGNEHVQFLENNNGSYSSPALNEITEQVDALKAGGWTVITLSSLTLTKDEYSTFKAAWPMVVLKYGARLYFPGNYTQTGYTLVAMGYTASRTADDKPMASNPTMDWLTVKFDGSLGHGEPLMLNDGEYYVLNKIVNDGTTFTEEELDAIAAHAPLVIIAQGDIAMACYFERITPNYIYFFQIMPDAHPQMNSYIINRTTRIAKKYNQRIGSVTTAGITPDTKWGQIEG